MRKPHSLICAGCLLLALLMFLLPACGSVTPGPVSTETEQPSESRPAETEASGTVLWSAEDLGTYTLVRSDLKTDASPELKGVQLLMKAARELFGKTPAIITDYTGNGGKPEGEYEVLIGHTAREASVQTAESLGQNEFTIRWVGKKLVIVGGDDYGTFKAVQYFIENYMKPGTLAVSVPEILEIKETYTVSYLVQLPAMSGPTRYDTMMAAVCIQGIMNRESSSKVYLQGDDVAKRWFELFTSEGEWLSGEEFKTLTSFDELLDVGLPYLKKVVIWDTDVPASVNAATTAAGVEDGIVLTETMYNKYKAKLDKLPVLDLRNFFDGSVTGSLKNDCYAWAIENYLEKGLCSEDFICYYTDAATERSGGTTSYVSVRDWAVYNRAFVFDLSPWADEAPFDELDQPIGADYNSFIRMLSTQYDLLKQKKTYEVCGFFNFTKYSHIGNNTVSKHDTVPTEWETVYLIAAYGGYQNTATEWCWNQSVHSQYAYGELKNQRPDDLEDIDATVDPNKVYLCVFMADYDSSYPLYNFLETIWKDPKRGTIPLAWGINPTLLDTYPDIISYYYRTATPNDVFTSDASAAGYFNPSRVPSEFWPTMIQHNKDYFKKMDLTIAPMILDWDKLDKESLDAFIEFAPDGIATIIIDFHGNGGSQATPFLYEDTMFCDQLENGGIVRETSLEEGYNILSRAIGTKNKNQAKFVLTRCVWTTPTYISDLIDLYRERNPNVDLEVVDIYTYFKLRRDNAS